MHFILFAATLAIFTYTNVGSLVLQ